MFYRGYSTAYEHPCMPGLFRLSRDISVLEEKNFYLYSFFKHTNKYEQFTMDFEEEAK